MQKKILLLSLLLLFPLFLSSTSISSNSFRITGYLPSYRLESSKSATDNQVMDLSGYTPTYESVRKISPNNINNFPSTFPESYKKRSIESWYGENVTDIIYFSIKPQTDGSLDLTDIKERDLSRLNNIIKNYGTNVYIAVSGDSSRFGPVSSSKETRSIFIKNLLYFCITHNLSGVDFDWEFPESKNEIKNFELLIDNTIEIFNQNHLSVSAAVSRHRPLSQEIYDKLDYINLMTYDFLGRHSTYESTIEAIEHMRIAYKIPPEKLNLGIPFYGRIYSGSHPQYWKKTMYYSKIMENFNPESNMDEAGGFYFNGIDTVSKKTEYAIKNNLRGIMIWELGQDTIDDYSLLNAISKGIKAGDIQ